MSKSLILCIGSPFGADQTGWRAARALRKHFADRVNSGQLEIKDLDRPGAGLIEYLQGRDCVVIVDAMRTGAPAGTVRSVELSELANEAEDPSSHSFGVAEALLLAEAMGGLPKTLHIFGIEATDKTTEEDWLPALIEHLKVCVDKAAA